ncbi:MAG: winged helix-turn-helix domain-containing protein, partial [Terriglobales bacterium]
IQEMLWPGGAEVERDDALNSIVRRLRRALRDELAEPHYVATVPGRGYRFIGLEREQATPTSGAAPTAALQRKKQMAVWAAAAALLMVVATVVLRPLPAPRIVRIEDLTSGGGLDFLSQPASDGAHFYYLQRAGGHWDLMQNAGNVTGAEVVPNTIPGAGGSVRLLDVSPDGSEWLLGSFQERGEPMQLWRQRVPGGAPVRLGAITTDDALWYPDGSRIVYGYRGGLWSVRPDGSEPRREGEALLGGGALTWMAWAPDGVRLRFTQSNTLWQWRRDRGMAPQRLAAALPRCCGNWTGDGRYYLFSEERDGVWNLWAQRQARRWFSAPGPVQLTFEPHSVFGAYTARKDAQVVVYQIEQREQPQRLDLARHEFQPLLEGRNAIHLEYSPDGRSLAFLDTRDATVWTAAMSANFQASDFRQLTLAGDAAAFPRWSPDGGSIAYGRETASGRMRSYVNPVGGGGAEALPAPAALADADVEAPDWSPDGRRLVVAVDDHPPEGFERYSLAIVTRASGAWAAVAGSDGLAAPRWSPDGRWLAAYSGDQHRLEIFDFKRQRWQVAATGKAFTFPEWSRDGRYVYAQDLLSLGQPLYRYAAGSWKQELVAEFSAQTRDGVHRAGFMSLAPDGSPLIAFNTGYANLRRAFLELP